MAIEAQMYSGFGFGDNLMNNGCGLNSLVLTPQQERLQNEQQVMQRVPPMDDAAYSQAVFAHIENRGTEIDLFINLQNERLKMALLEKSKQHMSLLLKKHESRIQTLIRRKDEEIEEAAKRTLELQDYLKRMEIENQAWQRAARENEAAAASLSSAIMRLRETAAAGDAESCCCPGDNNRKVKNEDLEPKKRKMKCKCCHVRDSYVIMLPCRHLCSCKDCDAFLDSCPVCKMAKRASIEALI